MSQILAGEEGKELQVPNVAGNYPQNLLNRLKTGRWEECFRPTEKQGVVLAADIRDFTKTAKDNDPIRVQSFLSEFFDLASRNIHRENGYVNKLLGDGLLAHFDDGKEVEAVRISEEMIRIFTGLRSRYRFNRCNLSVSITRADYIESYVGRKEYMDYTIIGPEINSLFRLLSQTEGGLIYTTENYQNALNRSYHYVFVGTKKFKGTFPIPCFSIIGPKTVREKRGDKAVACSKEECPEYYALCQGAWNLGRERMMDPNEPEFQFLLDCNKCGKDNKCWQWEDCQPRLAKKKGDKISQCCHVCSNFRNCFHSYQLGRQGSKMVRCNKQLQELFSRG